MSEDRKTNPLSGVIEYSAYHRMKAALETRISHMEAELWDAKKLIIELADALDWWAKHKDYDPEFAVELKKRAREATKPK